uniref:Uncharacterized protein n=2 Tax=Tetranychus urticae TaxID=32264 RepID=T1K750_TETUR
MEASMFGDSPKPDFVVYSQEEEEEFQVDIESDNIVRSLDPAVLVNTPNPREGVQPIIAERKQQEDQTNKVTSTVRSGHEPTLTSRQTINAEHSEIITNDTLNEVVSNISSELAVLNTSVEAMFKERKKAETKIGFENWGYLSNEGKLNCLAKHLPLQIVHKLAERIAKTENNLTMIERRSQEIKDIKGDVVKLEEEMEDLRHKLETRGKEIALTINIQEDNIKMLLDQIEELERKLATSVPVRSSTSGHQVTPKNKRQSESSLLESNQLQSAEARKQLLFDTSPENNKRSKQAEDSDREAREKEKRAARKARKKRRTLLEEFNARKYEQAISIKVKQCPIIGCLRVEKEKSSNLPRHYRIWHPTVVPPFPQVFPTMMQAGRYNELKRAWDEYSRANPPLPPARREEMHQCAIQDQERFEKMITAETTASSSSSQEKH